MEDYKVYPALGSLTPGTGADIAPRSRSKSTRDTAHRDVQVV